MSKDAPTPDPRMAEAALRNAQISEDALRWYQGIYDRDLRPAQDEDRAMRQQMIQQFLTDSTLQREFAREQQDYYRQTFKPIEERMARDAMEYDSQANIERRQGIAGAAVTQAFSQAREESNRNLSRYGLNPNSGAFAATNSRLANQQALANAGAQTGAAFDTIDRAIALRAGAANFGRNMPNTAAGYFGLAGQSGSMAGQMSSSGMNDMRANAALGGQGFGLGMQGYMNAGNIYGQDFNARMQGFNAQMQAIAGIGQAVGTAAGMYAARSSKDVKTDKREIREGEALKGIKRLDVEKWRYKDDDRKEHIGPYAEDFKREFGVGSGKEIAFQDAIGVTMKAVQDLAEEVDELKGKRGLKKADGGKIHKGKGPVSGPGGPIDDKIPAMLSNGEYVLPADTVQKVGVGTLDRLVKETHTPAATQRRRGLKRKGK